MIAWVWTNPDQYRENVARGIQPPGMVPDWVGEFALAEKLGVPVAELPNQPARLIYRASVLIEAERITHDMQSRKYRK